jgi:mono/diheme cytochrome c family protein
MARIQAILSASALLLVAGCGSEADQPGQDKAAAASADLVERGAYLVQIMDCAGCHNQGSFSAEPQKGPLAGGTVGFEVPGLGVFYPPNLTPHPETGLGRWSDQDIIDAVRRGTRPDGRELSPAMPWRAYAALSDEDARALAAFLKSLPPAEHQVPAPSATEGAPRPYLTVVAPAAGAAAR